MTQTSEDHAQDGPTKRQSQHGGASHPEHKQTPPISPPPQELFQLILETTAEGVIVTNKQGEITYANPAAEKLLKLTKDEITGRSYHAPEWKPLMLDGQPHPVEELPIAIVLLRGKAVFGYEHLIEREDGHRIALSVNSVPLRDEQGTTIGSVTSFRNITRQKLLEAEHNLLLIREQEARAEAEAERQRLLDLFIQAPAIICLLQGPDHVYIFANPLYIQLIGNRNPVGKPIREALPELEGQGLFELLDNVYATGEPFHGNEIKILLDRHNNGTLEEAYFNFVYQASRNAAGEVDGILVHAVEVTDQVHARESIQSSKQLLELAQHVGMIGTFEWYIPSNHLQWTPQLEVLYGLPPGGFEGKYKNWVQRVHPDDLPKAEESLQQAINGDATYNVEFRIIRPDGAVRWMLAKGEITAHNAKGRPLKMVGVNIDITERKEAEQRMSAMNERLQEFNTNLETMVAQRTQVLNQLNLELQRSNQELQDFAYVASHDLQEPLRKIQAFGNLLEEEYGPALGNGKAYLDRMRNAASRMRVLIDDLLTFSRVTTKALPFSPVDLNGITQEVLDDLEALIQTMQGTVEVASLPTIEADPRQMHQMLQNLIANALKFHKPGIPPVIKVYARVEDKPSATTQETPEQQCVLYVEDQGIGFDEKYLDRIFTVFQRLHGRNEYEGTGIGLAVVRKIVERHNGTITASTTTGKGATFIITLPLHHQ